METIKANIIKYLIENYNPEAIITYGSFSNGTNNKNSDFDAMIIADSPLRHDEAVVEDIVLDVFIYSSVEVSGEIDPEEFVQIHDGNIEFDNNGLATQLMKKVNQYLTDFQGKTRAEIIQEVAWCQKMLQRTERGDAESYYRWHWLLMDSLEIYFDILGKYYFGPKKALLWMKNEDKVAFQIYESALRELDSGKLQIWINYMEELAEQVI